jgi:hypothetical protein
MAMCPMPADAGGGRQIPQPRTADRGDDGAELTQQHEGIRDRDRSDPRLGAAPLSSRAARRGLVARFVIQTVMDFRPIIDTPSR